VRRTTVYVTHDQIEALSMGDRIAVMKDGEIVQIDTPVVLYDRPASVFVGSFIGSPPMNFMKATAKNGTAVGNGWQVSGPPGMDGKPLLLGIAPRTSASVRVPFRGRVVVSEPLGSHTLLTVKVGDDSLKVVAPGGRRVQARPDASARARAAQDPLDGRDDRQSRRRAALSSTGAHASLSPRDADLWTAAAAVLRANDVGGWTKPAPRLYPHQWSWDSAFIAIGLAHLTLRARSRSSSTCSRHSGRTAACRTSCSIRRSRITGQARISGARPT
jgi:hypothetical protein